MPASTPLDPDALIAGPRGRRVLAELVGISGVPGWWASVHGSGPAPAPEHPDDLAPGIADRVSRFADRFEDPDAVRAAIGVAVDTNMPWQEPDGDDRLLAAPAVTESLRPVAEALCAAPLGHELAGPLAVERQRHSRLTSESSGMGTTDPPALRGLDSWAQRWRAATVTSEESARQDLPTDPAYGASGEWWSTPISWTASLEAPWRAPVTSPPIPSWGPDGVGSSELVWMEDHGGWNLANVQPLAPASTPRVYEVTGPSAWGDLVRRFPLEVTASRRHDWYRHTGRDGAWAIPDWLAVREEFDAVHVTVAGYLTTAGQAVEVGDGVATVLAGWSPDLTAWLTDVLEENGPCELWQRRQAILGVRDHGWRRA